MSVPLRRSQEPSLAMVFGRSKAAQLPPCPQRPSWEEMEEDLTNSTKADVVFSLAKSILDDKGSSVDRRGSTNNIETTEATTGAGGKDAGEDEIFLRATEFVERNDELLRCAKRLAEESERLQEVSESLRETVEEVKKQALVAIDGC